MLKNNFVQKYQKVIIVWLWQLQGAAKKALKNFVPLLFDPLFEQDEPTIK